VPRPTRVEIVREKAEPRERRERGPPISFEPLIFPALAVGTLFFIAEYKEQIASTITRVFNVLPHAGEIAGSIDYPDVQLPIGGGGGVTAGGAGNDKYGIKKIYAGDKVTYNARNSDNPGRKEWEINTNGYLNMECTGYIKAGGDQIAVKMRGGKHNDSCPRCGCNIIVRFPTQYGKGDNFALECPHPQYDFKNIGTKFSYGSIANKWVGVKGIVWNTANSVHVEAWMDLGGLNSSGKPANNWKKFYETNVSGSQWRKNPINGPDSLVHFRIDNTNTSAKYMSVREIKPIGSSSLAFMDELYTRQEDLDRITVPY
jgi:hypothetical protein